MTAGWALVPTLVQLRREFDAVFTDRDHSSDGTIGDAAHQAEVSDHNDDEVGNVPIHDADHVHEVHALDVDSDLHHEDVTMWDVVRYIVSAGCPGRVNLRYVIFSKTIWSASAGWAPQPYHGASPHIEHAHFSASYTSSKEASTRPYGLASLIPKEPIVADAILAAGEPTLSRIYAAVNKPETLVLYAQGGIPVGKTGIAGSLSTTQRDVSALKAQADRIEAMLTKLTADPA